MNIDYIRYKYKFKNKLTLFLSENKIVITICFFMILIGVCLGVCVAIKYSNDIKLENLSDSNLIDFIKGDKGVWSLFFSYLIIFFINFFLIVLINFKPLFSAFSVFILMVKGYLIGFDLTVLIILYGLIGIINVVVVFIPYEIINFLILIIISSIAINQNFNSKKYGCNSCNKSNLIQNRKTYCLFLCLGVLFIFIKCLIMPIIRVTIIVD